MFVMSGFATVINQSCLSLVAHFIHPKTLMGLEDHHVSSSGPLAIGVLDPLSVRNTIVTWNFLRGSAYAVVWLTVAALILTRDLSAHRIDPVTAEHLRLCN